MASFDFLNTYRRLTELFSQSLSDRNCPAKAFLICFSLFEGNDLLFHNTSAGKVDSNASGPFNQLGVNEVTILLIYLYVYHLVIILVIMVILFFLFFFFCGFLALMVIPTSASCSLSGFRS